MGIFLPLCSGFRRMSTLRVQSYRPRREDDMTVCDSGPGNRPWLPWPRAAALRVSARAEDRITKAEKTMNPPNRRAFLGLARNAVAAAAIGAIGARFVEPAEAIPIAPAPGQGGTSSDSVTETQWWGPPPAPGWGPGPGWGPAFSSFLPR